MPAQSPRLIRIWLTEFEESRTTGACRNLTMKLLDAIHEWIRFKEQSLV